ncbi:MAG: SMI1/KNR4 family protein, partial [Planctomycetia bacterium]|nr:SMI1/KNR4 family protein [Planctomycetia bacterium]
MQSFPVRELLQDSYDPPLTPASLEELEIELGVRFPKEYADFLLEFNGGYFHRSVIFDLPNPTKSLSKYYTHGHWHGKCGLRERFFPTRTEVCQWPMVARQSFTKSPRL